MLNKKKYYKFNGYTPPTPKTDYKRYYNVKDLPGEIWLPINLDSYRECYDVSSYGRVRKHHRCRRVGDHYRNILQIDPIIMKVAYNHKGYTQTSLSVLGNRLSGTIHRFMKITFGLSLHSSCKGLKPEEMQVDHIDSHKDHNWLWNLELVSNEENIHRSHVNELVDLKPVIRYDVNLDKLTAIKNKIYTTTEKASKDLNVSTRDIRRCCNNRQELVAGKYIFRYASENPEYVIILNNDIKKTNKK